MGDPIPQAELTAFLDRINRESGLPHTILYTLNPAAYPALATAAGCFPQVYVGAAWWFNDHKSGIEEQLRICAQISAELDNRMQAVRKRIEAEME